MTLRGAILARSVIAGLAMAVAPIRSDARPHPDGQRRAGANPSAVIAAEIAFARLAQDKGQWTAFAATSTKDAVMFVPQRTNARTWLKGRANPPVAVKWQPHSVWMSCDGSYGVTKGAWQRPSGTGYFTTIWQRQKDGGYKWVLDQGDALKDPLASPEMISGTIADCARPAVPPTMPATAAQIDRLVGWSDDKTLQWVVDVRSDGSRTLKVHRWTGAGYEEVIRSEVAPD